MLLPSLLPFNASLIDLENQGQDARGFSGDRGTGATGAIQNSVLPVEILPVPAGPVKELPEMSGQGGVAVAWIEGF